VVISLAAPTITPAATRHQLHRHQYFHRYYHMAMVNYKADANAVFIGGDTIMRFRIGAGGYSPQERAAETQLRLNALVAGNPIFPEDITTEVRGDSAVVLVKGELLFTADPDTTAINDERTPLDLANKWADRMRIILPPLTEMH